MSMAHHVGEQGACRHGACLRFADGGWSACLTSWAHGVAVQVREPGRTRVVLAEPGTRGMPATLSTQARAGAARLLAAGLTAEESLDALRLLTIRQSGGRKPGPSLSVLDLHLSGKVEFAGCLVPPVLHVPVTGTTRCYPLGADDTCHELRLSPGDYVAMFSPSFVKLVPAPFLGSLPMRARGEPNPCQLRDALTASPGPALVGAPADQLPPAALVTLA